ncbi:MAG: transglycosylase SLT domain-containing protein [Alphaproteobacteria bacterium]|nr:transglycosylase SLT domain-containing protein [Alphaproteobacteria bacterium]
MSITSRQRQRGIPPELLARLFHRESDFKNQGVDRNGNATGGPVGIPQMYPDALRSVGVDPATFARAGAAAQIDAGAAYLAQQYRTFGNWPMAVAAYQFGPGRVANWLSGSGPTYENIEQRAKANRQIIVERPTRPKNGGRKSKRTERRKQGRKRWTS